MSKTSPMSPKINMSGSKFFFSFCATFSSKIIGSNKFSFQQSNLLFYQNPNPIKFNLQSHTISIKNYTHKFTLKEPILSNPFSRTIVTKHNIHKTCREFYSTTNITNIHITKIHTKPLHPNRSHHNNHISIPNISQHQNKINHLQSPNKTSRVQNPSYKP